MQDACLEANPQRWRASSNLICRRSVEAQRLEEGSTVRTTRGWFAK